MTVELGSTPLSVATVGSTDLWSDRFDGHVTQLSDRVKQGLVISAVEFM